MGNQCCVPHQEQEYSAVQKTQGLLLVQQQHNIPSAIHPAIIRLTFHSLNTSNNKMEADGVLISQHLVLTSAQNVYNRHVRTQNSKNTYKVYLGDHKNANEFYEVEDWRFPQGFKTATNGKERVFDYALLKLKPNAQRSINIKKYLDVSLPCQCLLSQDLKDRYKLSERSVLKSKLSQNRKEQVKDLKQSLYEAQEEQQSGQFNNIIIRSHEETPYLSGHPVLIDNKIIAIHLKGDSNQQNFERLVTVNMIDHIKKWSEELKSPFVFQSEHLCSHIREKMEVLKEESLQAAKGLVRVAREYFDEENYSAALENYLKSLAIFEKLKMEGGPEMVKVLLGIGKVYKEQGNYVKTHQYYSKSLQLQRTIKGMQSQEASILDKIAEVYLLQQIFLESIRTYIESLRVKEKLYGKESMQAAETLLTIGNLYRTQQRYPKAQEYLLQALQITQKIKGKHSLQTAQILYNLANVSYRRKEYPKSVQIYKQALSIFDRLDHKPKNYAYSQFNLGNTYCKMKQYKMAAQSFQDSIFSFKRQKMEEDVTKSAMKLAKCLKILKQIKRLNQVIAEYKIDPQAL